MSDITPLRMFDGRWNKNGELDIWFWEKSCNKYIKGTLTERQFENLRTYLAERCRNLGGKNE